VPLASKSTRLNSHHRLILWHCVPPLLPHRMFELLVVPIFAESLQTSKSSCVIAISPSSTSFDKSLELFFHVFHSHESHKLISPHIHPNSP
jgi:hypothetical protein